MTLRKVERVLILTASPDAAPVSLSDGFQPGLRKHAAGFEFARAYKARAEQVGQVGLGISAGVAGVHQGLVINYRGVLRDHLGKRSEQRTLAVIPTAVWHEDHALAGIAGKRVAEPTPQIAPESPVGQNLR